jgi:hypothetical protein
MAKNQYAIFHTPIVQEKTEKWTGVCVCRERESVCVS